MKKIGIILLLFVSLPVFAQEKYDSLKMVYPQKIKTIVKTSPFSPFIGAIPIVTAEYRFLYETVTAANQSTQLGFSYLGKGFLIKLMEDSLRKRTNFMKFYITGFRFQGAYRFYLNGAIDAIAGKKIYAPLGFYLSPHFSYASAKITYKFYNQFDIGLRVIHYNFNLLAGVQFAMFKKLAMDFFCGLGYKQNLWYEEVKSGKSKQIPPDTFKDFPMYTSPLKITMGMNMGWCF